MDSLEDMVLKRVSDTKHENTKTDTTARNSKDDVDVEWIELRRFLKDCMDGQTYALDMLFAPKEYWIESTPIWDKILEAKHLLLSKHVQPYIGYCRQQAGKYGLKGSRLGELLRVISHLKDQTPTISIGEAIEGMPQSEFVKTVVYKHKKTGVEEPMLEVLGKKFEHRKKVKECLPALELTNEKYGQRAKLAMDNEGVDFKAISHAFRCCYQLIELAETSGIKFPLRDAEYLRKIKVGAIPYIQLQEPLYDLMEQAIKAVEKSNLQEEPSREYWEGFILHTYLGI